MSYEPGTRIDLSYLNKKAGPANDARTLSETATNLMDVGTRISFKLINKRLASARQIPVVFA